MDLKAVGQRIQLARIDKKLTQEQLADRVGLTPSHISIIERGEKATKIDNFVAIANELEVSADSLLVDVLTNSVESVENELWEIISEKPKEEQLRIINAVRALVK
jgi:transcriptional regulator with XRE-family HTH domain